jgi:hypothetical protein
MTSNIDPTKINAAFPVKGQDNPSQGFRDNFQGTVDGLTQARDEINQLQLNQVTKGINSATVSRLDNSNDFRNNMYGAEFTQLQLNNVTHTESRDTELSPAALCQLISPKAVYTTWN